MYLTIRYSDGRFGEAVVLSASADRMRISVPDYDDVMELRKNQDFWISEAGEAVQIESIVLTTAGDTLFREMHPLTLSASGGPVI